MAMRTRSMRRPASSPGKRTSSTTSTARKNSSGPIVANGKVISGRSCEPEGGPEACVVTAHDAKTGKELWRHAHDPEARRARRRDLGRRAATSSAGTSARGWCRATTRRLNTDLRRHVGHRSRAEVHAGGQRQAVPLPQLDARAGRRARARSIWYYQHVVDNWDLDHPFERLIVDTAVAPDPKRGDVDQPERCSPARRRKVITGIPGKTGIVYTLDARHGRVPLGARRRSPQNVITNIDGATGEVTVNPGVVVHRDRSDEARSARARHGGKNWPSGAYSPLHEHDVLSAAEHVHAGNVGERHARPDETPLRLRARRSRSAPGAKNVGTCRRSRSRPARRCGSTSSAPAMLSLMSTGGGLVFGGDVERHTSAPSIRRPARCSGTSTSAQP